jgi:hypothetical protein
VSFPGYYGGRGGGFTCTPLSVGKNRLAARLPTARSSPGFDLQEASKGSVKDPDTDPNIFGLTDQDPDPSNNSKKNLDLYYFLLLFLLFIFEE